MNYINLIYNTAFPPYKKTFYNNYYKLLIFLFLYKLYGILIRKIPTSWKDFLLSIPILKDKIKVNLLKNSKNLELNMQTKYNNLQKIPENGMKYFEIENIIQKMGKQNISNQISGIIYLGDKRHNENMVKIFNQFSFSNPLHPDLFPEIREMEIDIINIAKYFYKGDEKSCGNVTYGGTESILLACVTYRDYYKYHKKIKNPNIVCYETVHPAFDKACHYFGIEQIKINITQSIERFINSNTILIVGSCPEYSYGTADPIINMAEIAKKYNIGLHIDCCMGGFLIPFLEEYKNINFDLEGVTSISMDTHKYGYSLKGSSILLFKNYELKKFQHYINKDWKGGVYATPTMMGSKSGGIIAATWASLLLIGEKKYKQYALEIQNNLKYIKKSILESIPEIQIINNPNINIIAFKSDEISIYHVINEMKKKKWELTVMQNPQSFHLCLTKMHDKHVCEKFCKDLKSSVETSKNNNKELEGTLALYGSSEKIENSLFIDEIIHDYIFLLSSNNCTDRYINTGDTLEIANNQDSSIGLELHPFA